MDRQIQNLRIRIERLEAQSGRVKLIAGAVVVVLSVLLVGGQTSVKQPQTSRVVEAEEFILRDKNGKKRGRWAAGSVGSTVLALFDGKERYTTLLIGGDDSSSLKLLNYHQGAVAALSAEERGASVGLYKSPMVSEWLMGSDGWATFDLLTERPIPEEIMKQVDELVEKRPQDFKGALDRLLQNSTVEQKRYGQWVAKAGTGTLIELNDGKGRSRVEISADSGGSPSIVLLDDKGTKRAVLGTGKTIAKKTGVIHQHPESSLRLYDEDTNVIFVAP